LNLNAQLHQQFQRFIDIAFLHRLLNGVVGKFRYRSAPVRIFAGA
jgi:hypothetical protein